MAASAPPVEQTVNANPSPSEGFAPLFAPKDKGHRTESLNEKKSEKNLDVAAERERKGGEQRVVSFSALQPAADNGANVEDRQGRSRIPRRELEDNAKAATRSKSRPRHYANTWLEARDDRAVKRFKANEGHSKASQNGAQVKSEKLKKKADVEFNEGQADLESTAAVELKKAGEVEEDLKKVGEAEKAGKAGDNSKKATKAGEDSKTREEHEVPGSAVTNGALSKQRFDGVAFTLGDKARDGSGVSATNAGSPSNATVNGHQSADVAISNVESATEIKDEVKRGKSILGKRNTLCDTGAVKPLFGFVDKMSGTGRKSMQQKIGEDEIRPQKKPKNAVECAAKVIDHFDPKINMTSESADELQVGTAHESNSEFSENCEEMKDDENRVAVQGAFASKDKRVCSGSQNENKPEANCEEMRDDDEQAAHHPVVAQGAAVAERENNAAENRRHVNDHDDAMCEDVEEVKRAHEEVARRGALEIGGSNHCDDTA